MEIPVTQDNPFQKLTILITLQAKHLSLAKARSIHNFKLDVLTKCTEAKFS